MSVFVHFKNPGLEILMSNKLKGDRMEKQIALWLGARSELLLTRVGQQPETYDSNRFIITLVLQ